MAGIDSCLSNSAFSKGLTDGIFDCEQWVLSDLGHLRDKPKFAVTTNIESIRSEDFEALHERPRCGWDDEFGFRSQRNFDAVLIFHRADGNGVQDFGI